MRKIVAYFSVLASIALLSSCAAAWQNVSYSDDLYQVHNQTAIAQRQKAEAELAKAQYEAQQAQYEANLARIKSEAAMQGVSVAEGSSNFNAYDGVLADSYESAYARRLYGFSSPTYRMPSSYYTLRYSDAFFYASAYDPAFYNVMVSGDTLFEGCCGRWDLGGDERDMMISLRRLHNLPGDYKVLPGHGPATTLARERITNPYMKAAVEA